MSIKKSNTQSLQHAPVNEDASRQQAGGHQQAAPAIDVKKVAVMKKDFASDFEEPITILADLLSIAMEEIGNGSGRAISVLLPAMRYVHDIKTINERLLQAEKGE